MQMKVLKQILKEIQTIKGTHLRSLIVIVRCLFMDDKRIIDLYNQGYSMKYISNAYYRFKCKNNKPIRLGNDLYYPVQLFSKSDCFLYVSSTIYRYIINKDSVY